MIRNIQNLPAAGQAPVQTRQSVRRHGADFGSMLQRQMRDERQNKPRTETGFQPAAAEAGQAAAEANQAAAIRQAMGIQPAAAASVAEAAAVQAGSIGTEAVPPALPGAVRQTVNFSKHAMARVEARGIQLTDTLLNKLADSVEKAQEKGAKNILAFDTTQAFIINIPYSRVITAISQEEMRENIFTNIDGAVLL